MRNNNEDRQNVVAVAMGPGFVMCGFGLRTWVSSESPSIEDGEMSISVSRSLRLGQYTKSMSLQRVSSHQRTTVEECKIKFNNAKTEIMRSKKSTQQKDLELEILMTQQWPERR